MEIVAVIGLGNVGLPLAVDFGKLGPTIGYELACSKLASCHHHVDLSGTVSERELRSTTLQSCFVDPKSRFNAHALQAAGLRVWCL